MIASPHPPVNATPLPLAEARLIAESVAGVVTWQDAEHGFCACPGQDLHEHPNGARHCRVSLDKVPTIHCVHSSCMGVIEEANRRLRSALAKRAFSGQRYVPSSAELAERARRQIERDAAIQLRASAHASRDEI